MKIPQIERATKAEIKAFQDKKLSQLIQYLATHSPYYQRIFNEQNISPDAIQTLDDLSLLPMTTKQDLQQYNDDFICVDRRQIIDYVTTSGTMGKPVTFALTDKDLDRLAYNEATSFASAGIDDNDVLLLTTTIDRRFMAGLAYFLGARKLGAGIVRVGSGLPALQWDTIKRVSPTALIAVPSFIFKLIEYAKKNGIDYQNSSIKKAICIGESLRNSDFSLNTLGQKITDLWDIELYSTYASTEMSTAFTECEYSRGGHHHPELIIVEILDEAGQPVPEGVPGEVVISTLEMEAMPLLRFRTGDICEWYQDACSCGRTTLRLGPVLGRKGQMIKYKGTTLYPPALYNLLNQFEEIVAFVIEVFTNEIGTDEIIIKICSKDASPRFQKRIKDHFRAKLRVAPKVEFSDFETINALRFPAMSRKPVLFFDHR
ncbi:phenylacetate--CoA ligase family protein [Aureispira anguillae]|uniref:AMP-binding protein n=1 Tax=Aureispira anguillae TaxID=2864201 RepID=A0A915YM97_9BACT|nr:AMP-binding protein [Aureispira anguillae]BDS15571.1 AMP-binding protein [Aureispira anguillae]